MKSNNGQHSDGAEAIDISAVRNFGCPVPQWLDHDQGCIQRPGPFVAVIWTVGKFDSVFRSGSIATDWRCPRRVRFPPFATKSVRATNAASGQQLPRAGAAKMMAYSITLSARATRPAGTSSPIALAACRLMTNSNLAGCSTGISAGLIPWRIFTTIRASWRNISVKLGP